MYLVDTNLWIKHFQGSNSDLFEYLINGKVMIHDFIIGELSLGSFKKSDRSTVLDRLKVLEKVPVSTHEDVLKFIEKYQLSSAGVGFIDAHLLHACYVNKVKFMTLDRNVIKLSVKLGLHHASA